MVPKDTADKIDANAILASVKAAENLKEKAVVVSCSGATLASTDLKQKFCQDVAALQALGIYVVVVHGGGPQINHMLNRLDVESRFEGGVRVSSPQVVQVAEMVCGSINKELSALITAAGGSAVGFSGRDNNLLQCVKQESQGSCDLEMAGKVEAVNGSFLRRMYFGGVCPVIGLIGTGMREESHLAYTVDADDVVRSLATELRPARVVFLTDVAGVLDENKELLPRLSVDDVNALIADKTITGGMISKVLCANSAVKSGVQSVFIVDGRVPHALLREVLGGGMGTRTGGTVVTLE